MPALSNTFVGSGLVASTTLTDSRFSALRLFARRHKEPLRHIRRILLFLKRIIDALHRQKLFVDNPFILSLAFAFPVVVFHEQVSVGGGKFSGKGQKITDFIMANALTNNLALIELKTPSTKLLGHVYRSSVYPPSQELTAAITQILDQRYRIQSELAQLKDNSRRHDIERFSVECVVIAGTMPVETEERKCFEMFRGTLHGVSVVTFDELLGKLQDLHRLLRAGEDTVKALP
jgi:Domain of unknown function (DUF4263)